MGDLADEASTGKRLKNPGSHPKIKIRAMASAIQRIAPLHVAQWIGTEPRAPKPTAGFVVRHEFDIHWESTLVDQFTSQPFVEDVLDGMTLSSVFHAHADRMRGLKVMLEGLAIPHSLAIWEALSTRGRNRDQHGEERTFPATALPKKQRIFDSCLDTHQARLFHALTAAISGSQMRSDVCATMSEANAQQSRIVCGSVGWHC